MVIWTAAGIQSLSPSELLTYGIQEEPSGEDYDSAKQKSEMFPMALKVILS